jgi:hypothetical protein
MVLWPRLRAWVTACLQMTCGLPYNYRQMLLEPLVACLPRPRIRGGQVVPESDPRASILGNGHRTTGRDGHDCAGHPAAGRAGPLSLLALVERGAGVRHQPGRATVQTTSKFPFRWWGVNSILSCAMKFMDGMGGNVRHEAHRWNEGKPLKPVLGRRQAFEP